MRSTPKDNSVLCNGLPGLKEKIAEYSVDLVRAAHTIGNHGLNAEEFSSSGIFHGAIEKLRGTRSASMSAKHQFLQEILKHLKTEGMIIDFKFTGQRNRHDYQVTMQDGPGERLVIFEAKGCLDGNNTNIFKRPPNADEFYIWSLCQNKGADPKHNVWSGLHTRLGAKIVAEREPVDGLIVWDMNCGTACRPCPKKQRDSDPMTKLFSGASVPPPCLYLFPRTIPEPRDNAKPPVWKLADLRFLAVLAKTFKCTEEDVTSVCIETEMRGPNVWRKTVLWREAKIVAESRWTELKRTR